MLSNSILLPPSPNWYGAQLLAVQPDAGLAAYAGHNSVVVLCCQTDRILRTMCAGPSRVTSLAWAPAAAGVSQLVAGHEDGSLRTWDARTGACLRSSKKKGAEVSALVLLPRQPAEALVGDVKGGLQLWAFQTGAKPRPFGTNLRSKVCQLVAIQPLPWSTSQSPAAATSTSQPYTDTPAQPEDRGALLAAACADGTVNLIDVDAGVVVHCFSAHRGCIHALSGGTWSTTPDSLRSLGCALLLTASGEEGAAKVWQVAMSGRSPSVSLMTTLLTPGGRHDGAGGRHGKQRSSQPQWLSACLLPTCSPRFNTWLAGHPLGSTVPAAAGVAKDQAWVALGLGTGEVCMHVIHTDSGLVHSPYKLNNLHNRPIYSLMSMPHLPTSQEGVDQVDGTDTGSGLVFVSPAALTTASGLAPKRPLTNSLRLVSVSQDRTVVITRVDMKVDSLTIKPAVDLKKRNKGKGSDSGAAATPGEPGAAAAAGQPAGGDAQASSKPPVAVPPPPPPSAPAPAPGVQGGPGEQAGAEQTQPVAKSKAAIPTFRTAKGPPTDVSTDRGFAGGRNRRSGSGSGAAGQDGAAPQLQASEEPGAADADPPPPAPMTAPVVPPSIQPRVDAAAAPGDGTAAQPLVVGLQVSGFAITCKVPGLGGYAHSLYMHNQTRESEGDRIGYVTSSPAPGGASQVTCQAERTWGLVVGCGDRTMRSAAFTWPTTIRITSDAATQLPTGSEAASAQSEVTSGGEPGAAGTAPPPAAAAAPAAATTCEVSATSAPADQPTASRAATLSGAAGARLHLKIDHPKPQHSVSMWKGLTDQVTCVKRHPRPSRFIAFGCQDGQVGVYDTTLQTGVLYPTRHQGPVVQLHWVAVEYPPDEPPVSAGAAQVAAAATSQSGAAQVNTGRESTSGAAPVADSEQGVQPTSEVVSDGAELDNQTSSSAVPPPPPPPPAQSAAEQADGQVVVEPGQPGPGAKPEVAKQKAQAGKGRGKASPKDELLTAQHVQLQQWQLVSLGAEGRMLTWQLPSRDDFSAAGSGQSVMSGPQRSAAGTGDRADRWGHSNAAAATTYSNDFLVQLTASLPPGSIPAEAKSVSAVCSVPRHPHSTTSTASGDLLVLALADEVLVLEARRMAAVSQQQGGRVSGAGAGAGPGQTGSKAFSWQVVWRRKIEAGATSILSCAASTASPGTIHIACASISGIITCYTCSLADTVAQLSVVDQATQQTAQQQQDAVVVGDRTKTISALTWLADGTALAAACVQDVSIYVWHMAPSNDIQAAAQDQAGNESAPQGPVLMTVLKGHTEQVTALGSGCLLASPLPNAALVVRDQLLNVVWLVSCSRDQSVRSWVLDLSQLLHQALQQQDAPQVPEEQPDTEVSASDAGADAQSGGGGAPQVPTTITTSRKLSPSAGVFQFPASKEPSTGGAVTPDQQASASSMPAASTPVKSEIVGLPGGRAKGGRKPPMLGTKTILDPAPLKDPSLQSVSGAAQELLRLLSQPQSEEATGLMVTQLCDPAALAAADMLPRAPEKLIMAHVWSGDVRQALQVAVSNSLLSADLVSVSASMGRAVWAAVSRLYAAQQEHVGQAHVAVMHLLAIGDRAGAAAVYRRVGLLQEAKAVEGTLGQA